MMCVGFCEHCDETLGAIKEGNFLTSCVSHQLLKETLHDVGS